MNSQKLHDWLQIIGIAAVVASLVSVGNQFYVDSYAANIHRYAGFKQMAKSWSDWGELEELEPNPNADVMWCGIR